MIELLGLERVENSAVEELLDRAFGADRHGRTAYRLREGVPALTGPSLAAVENGALLGTIQLWPVLFSGDDGRRVPLVLVGPVAVVPERQRDGIGRQLVAGALARVTDAPLMLIGDPEYYGRFFGFSAASTAGWRLPGPVERRRLLARGEGVPDGQGSIGPRHPLIA
ncbi:GNAT family N-acetyltransferase [Sphingomonas sp. IC4-52]|uniref:GNAT family N-acetyltransferase n=1 Tax=Sphingomonas sp. IC4-52 TaxID=2887202 RepID=UPI001D123C45|nr:N-acetyltransferase [Sphingomonas sp. IC4-52]MCC2978695.1 N-acetyltransferase [Sphingomonas sp. IC4-52]